MAVPTPSGARKCLFFAGERASGGGVHGADECAKRDKWGGGAGSAGARPARRPRGEGRWYGGCMDVAMTPLPLAVAPANPHLDRLGGEPAVRRLVDAFYGAMDRRPEARALRAMHAADLSATKAVLVMYLVEWLGGARRYSAERGAPRLRRAHAPFAVDAAAASAWLACMAQALEETCPDADLRTSLLTAFTGIANHLRNA